MIKNVICCDICGREIPQERKKDYYQCLFPLVVTPITREICNHVIANSQSYIELLPMDLCPNCARELGEHISSLKKRHSEVRNESNKKE